MKAIQASRTLLGGAQAAVRGRAFVREILGSQVSSRSLDDALLLVTELTNVAVGGRERAHDHRIFRFVVDAEEAGRLRLCVEDGPIDIKPPSPDLKDALLLIAHLSSAWGVMDAPTPLIWAELQLEAR